MITARLWAVTQARIRSRNAAERLGAKVPSAATPATEDEPSTMKSTTRAVVSAELVSARRISPAAAITSG